MDIGNIKNIVCDRVRVGGYITSSPTPSEKDCLRRFFQDVRTGSRTVPHQDIGGQFLIYVCGHILRVAFTGDNMNVRDIRRGVV